LYWARAGKPKTQGTHRPGGGRTRCLRAFPLGPIQKRPPEAVEATLSSSPCEASSLVSGEGVRQRRGLEQPPAYPPNTMRPSLVQAAPRPLPPHIAMSRRSAAKSTRCTLLRRRSRWIIPETRTDNKPFRFRERAGRGASSRADPQCGFSVAKRHRGGSAVGRNAMPPLAIHTRLAASEDRSAGGTRDHRRRLAEMRDGQRHPASNHERTAAPRQSSEPPTVTERYRSVRSLTFAAQHPLASQIDAAVACDLLQGTSTTACVHAAAGRKFGV